MIKKDFKILYLDQFAVSNLVLEEKGVWIDLKEIIEEGVKEGKLLCPITFDHFFETTQADPERALKIDAYFSFLSNGWMFKPTAYTDSQLIISTLRKNNFTLKTFLNEDIKRNILSDKSEFEHLKKGKNEFDLLINEATAGINSLRKVKNNQKVEKEDKKIMYNALSLVSTREFLERLNDLVKNGNIVIRGDKLSFKDVPNWVDQIIFRLVEIHKMTSKETKKLISIIQKHNFSKFPTLDIRFSLLAKMSIEGKKELPSDHIDVERISVGLPISDYLLTDKKRKSEIIDLGLDLKYNTKVYCGSENDLNRLKSDLQLILE